MARTYTPPASGKAKPFGGNPAPKERKRYTPAEARAQEQILEELLLANMTSRPAMINFIADKTGQRIGINRVNVLTQRIFQRWADEDATTRQANKAAAERRLKSYALKAAAEKKWSAVARFEELLSKVQGTQEPLRVSLDVETTTAIMGVVGTMSADDMNRLLDEDRAQRRLTAAALRLLPAGVLEAEASVVSDQPTETRV